MDRSGSGHRGEASQSDAQDKDSGPTEADVEKLKAELMESLENETAMLDRQVELEMEGRNLRIEIEKAKTKKKMEKINAQMEQVAAAKEAAES